MASVARTPCSGRRSDLGGNRDVDPRSDLGLHTRGLCDVADKEEVELSEQTMHLKLLRTKLDVALRAWEDVATTFPSRAVAYGWCADLATVIEDIDGWLADSERPMLEEEE